MKKGFVKLVLLLSLVFIFPFVNPSIENYCVTSSVSDISPSSMEIEEDFTIGIQIENCGAKIPDFVSFELINPPVELLIKEPLVTNISRFYYGNSERFLVYHMKTTKDAVPGTYLIKTRLTYGGSDYSLVKDDIISFQVRGNKAELGISSSKTRPVLPIEGESVELTLRIENIGQGIAKSVRVYADHPFQGVKQSFIGSLNSNEEGPAIFTFITNEYGKFEFPVTIYYRDDFGEKEITTNIEINILKKESNKGIMFFIFFLLIVIGLGIFYFIKTKKAKDKIIHQLLK